VAGVCYQLSILVVRRSGQQWKSLRCSVSEGKRYPELVELMNSEKGNNV
jgi:hypothetical protein